MSKKILTKLNYISIIKLLKASKLRKHTKNKAAII